MTTQENTYDYVIIGSGLGGLVCGCILASEGFRVAVLEKNNQIGGMLQVFSREKAILDTGVHYIGGLNPGENLYQIFRYLGILDDLKLKKLDADCVDLIRLSDGSEFRIPQGYDRFTQYMVGQFPQETEAIYTYCEKVRETCSHFPLYHLDASLPKYLENPELLGLKAYDYIAGITKDERLRQVLAGTNSFLYAGNPSLTPFYVHALIVNSYLTGAYRLIDGGSQIAISLSRQIRSRGGKILRRKKVTGALYHEDKRIKAVVTEDGDFIYGQHFISNLHPAVTTQLFGQERFLKSYCRRVHSLSNSISSFTVHLIFKKDSFPYLNYNIYQYHEEGVWNGLDYHPEKWPEQYFLNTPAHSGSEQYADSMSVMAFMRYEEVAQWADTLNTVTEPGSRGEAYETFKREKEEQVIRKVETLFPDIRQHIKAVYSSTPLTFRDYTGSPEGSMFGIVKNADNPMSTLIGAKTHVPNLFLTGQNVFMHGILGVSLGAIATCTIFLDREKLISKIADA